MTAEERAYNYASTQRPTKLQVGEIAQHYNNGYNQAIQDFLGKAKKWIEYEWSNSSVANLMFNSFKNYMQNESEN